MRTETIPMIYDRHNHFYFYAALYNAVSLEGIRTKEEALKLLAAMNNPMNLAFGWNDSCYTFTEDDLDALSPCLILNISLHRFCMNTAGRHYLQKQEGERLELLQNIEWQERNYAQFMRFITTIAPPTPQTLLDFHAYLRDRGVQKTDDLCLNGPEALECYKQAGLLESTRIWSSPDIYQTLKPQEKQEVYGFKLFLDGALGARTANLLTSFNSGKNGIQVFSDTELITQLEKIGAEKKHIAIHTVGDGATEQAVRIFKSQPKVRQLFDFIRLEHCQLIAKKQAKNLKDMGIALSMQTIFSSESIDYQDRLSKSMCQRNNPFRMLIDDIGFKPGKDLFFSSDGMPHGLPEGLTSALFPPLENQKLTLEEWVAGACLKEKGEKYIELQIDHQKQEIQYTTHF